MIDVRNLAKNICQKGKNKNLFEKIYKVISCKDGSGAYDTMSYILKDLLSDPMTQKVTIDLIKGSRSLRQVNKGEMISVYKVLYMNYISYIQKYSTEHKMTLNQMKDWFLES